MIKKMLWLPVLVFSLSFSQGAFSSHNHIKQAQDMSHCMQNAIHSLHLTADQQKQIDAIKAQVKQNRQELMQKMSPLHDQIKALVRADTWDESKLDSLINQKKELIASYIKVRVTAKHQMYTLLDEKQKAKFSVMVDKCEASHMNAM